MQPYILKPYIFSSTAAKNIPTGEFVVEMFNKLMAGETLSRNEKNSLFHAFQGNSGKYNYRLAGWIFPFKQFLKRRLVKYKGIGWEEVWSFDKTCIRFSYYTNRGIVEIVQH